MDIFQIIAVAFITLILVVLLKQHRPEIALMAALGGGIIIFLGASAPLGQFFGAVEAFANSSGLGEAYIRPVLKIAGIAYISHYGAQLCNDAGESALGVKVEMAGKMIILAITAPIVGGLFNTIAKIIP